MPEQQSSVTIVGDSKTRTNNFTTYSVEHTDGQPSSPPSRCKITIVGDSTLRMLNPTRLRRNLKKSVSVKTFPGARLKDMKHYINPTLESLPECIVIHAGTNDLKNKSTEMIT